MTDKTKLSVRAARRADIEAFFGQSVPVSVRARVMERDGDIVALCGYYIAGGQAAVFSDIKDKALPKLAVWREAVRFMKTIKVPAYCIADDGSAPFLERLGWKWAGDTNEGGLFQWEA